MSETQTVALSFFVRNSYSVTIAAERQNELAHLRTEALISDPVFPHSTRLPVFFPRVGLEKCTAIFNVGVLGLIF